MAPFGESIASPLDIQSFKSSLFLTSGNYLLGWFRDYLWANCGHLCWAVGFMFLISWRVTPAGLSIVQARFIGVFHFSAGFISWYHYTIQLLISFLLSIVKC